MAKKKPTKSNLDTKLMVRVSTAELTRLKKAAGKKVKFSEWVRATLLSRADFIESDRKSTSKRNSK